MSQKVAVVTGAGSGLGQALAEKLAADDWKVCLLGRSKEKLERVQHQLAAESEVYAVDVRSKQDVAATFAQIRDDQGTITVLVNNAGLGIFDLAENLSENAVHQMIDTNLKGTIFCSQEVLPAMKRENAGMIVNIVSTAGQVGKVTESVYCASKFGMKGFTEGVKAELAETDVRVFAAYMGGMTTPFWEGIQPESTTQKLMNPTDVADIIYHSMKTREGLEVSDLTIKNKIS